MTRRWIGIVATVLGLAVALMGMEPLINLCGVLLLVIGGLVLQPG